MIGEEEDDVIMEESSNVDSSMSEDESNFKLKQAQLKQQKIKLLNRNKSNASKIGGGVS